MKKKILTAVLGSTGYVGLELINILIQHPNIVIKYLGSNSFPGKNIGDFDKRIKGKILPSLKRIEEIDLSNLDVVFLALPHSISHHYVSKNINKCKIIDLSADFRVDNIEIYKNNYSSEHSCPELLSDFVYGLSEINFDLIQNTNNIAVPGCYPTSILLPLIPLLQNDLIKCENIIIDSKSGYSGAGKKFNKKNIFQNENFNFYNYNTNNHRHICEIHQELSKYTQSEIKFSFNPHILPIFRGLMSTIYCDLNKTTNILKIKQCLETYYNKSKFVHIINDDRADFFNVQNSNNCHIKLHDHYDDSKVIIVSLIDNLIKGAAGQAVQCMNIMFNFAENLGLDKLKND